MKRIAWLLIPALVATGAAPVIAAPVTPDLTLPKPYVLAAQNETPLAQGLTLTSFERLYPRGWVNGWLLEVDLAHPAITTDLVTAPGVTKGEALSAMAGRAGAVAAINGDFFDIGQTGIALGSVVKGGQYLQTRIPDWPHAASVGKDRIGRLMEITLQGTVTLPGGAYPLGAVNLPTVPSHTIGLFTPMWTIPRSKAMYGAAEAREVVVRNGKVVSVSPVVTDQPVPADGFVLVGREEFAAPLASLKVGDRVSLSYRANPDVQWAVGGMRYLVGHGKIVEGLNDTQAGPRSALGFSADGRRMFLLAVDGRSERSGGLTLQELAEMMRGFGAAEVLELDGGGSTTMVARLPGAEGLSLLNRPSDGRERSIPNGVGIFAAKGSGVARHLAVKGDARVFPGLSRRFTAVLSDEQYNPVQVGGLAWRVEGQGSISPDGLFRAAVGGTTTIVAEAHVAGGAPGTLAPPPPASLLAQIPVRLLGPLDRIEVVGSGLRLLPGSTATFAVRGYDSDGYSTLIDPADLTFRYDQSLVKVEAVGDLVQVTPLKEGTGLIELEVQGRQAAIPFASAHATSLMDAFDQPEGWRFERYPATVSGAISAAPGRSGNGLKLTYTFGDGGNRAAYVQAAQPLELPGQPERVGLWAKGDGKGAWLRAVLIDAKNVSYTVDLARNVDWTDWRYVEAGIPAGVTYPVRLQRVYPVETDQTKKYTGELVFDDLTVKTAVALPPAPPAPPAEPDLILQPGVPAGAGSFTFALVGGLGLAPGAPPAAELEAQRVIRQAMGANPSFFLLDPGQATPAGEALLRREAGATPVYTLTPPGRSFDVSGTRFILLSTEKGSLRATQFDQLLALQTLLSSAELDPDVQRLVVVGQSTPLRFQDQREGELVRQWLTEFEEKSGKPAVYLAGGGSTPSVKRVEGIPMIEAGSQQAPALVTIDPTPGATWIRPQAR